MSPDTPVLPPRPVAADRSGSTLADRFHHLRREPLVGVLAIALVVVAAGAMWFRTATAAPASGDQPTEVVPADGEGVALAPGAEVSVDGVADPLSATGTDATVPGTAPPEMPVVVHVAGAVKNPGVVTLDPGARVIDAVEAAGGAGARADLDRLNLAALVGDGQRVLVARVGDPPSPATADIGTGSAGSGGDDPGDGPLDLNVATADQLEALPGIGPERAAAIVAERDRRGGFTSVGQLTSVRGIGDKTLAELRALVAV